MHYYAYEFAHTVLSPLRLGVSGLRSMLDSPFNPHGQHAVRPPSRRGLRAVRERHAPLRQAGVRSEDDARRRRRGRRARADRRLNAVRPPAALQARRDRAHRQALRPQGADRGADVGSLRDAAARHRQGDAARPRDLHHRLERRARHPARHGPLRSRRLHRPRHRVHSRARPRHARHRRVPAGRAGARRRGAHGLDRRSLPARVDDADGRSDRHAAQSDRRQQARRKQADRVVREQRRQPGALPARRLHAPRLSGLHAAHRAS